MDKETEKQALEAFELWQNNPDYHPRNKAHARIAWLAAWEARGRASGQQGVEDFLRTMRAVNVDRCVNGFKHALDYWSIMEWGCAIGGEAGELLNVLKKIQREKQGLPGSRLGVAAVDEVGNEIADIVLYCDLLAAQFDIDLTEVITKKFNATSAKLGVPHSLAASPQISPDSMHTTRPENAATNRTQWAAQITMPAPMTADEQKLMDCALLRDVTVKHAQPSDSVQGWLPIETAPKDGNNFLTYNANQGGIVWIAWWSNVHKYFVGSGGKVLLQFTHWMPLPEPPGGT